MARLAELLRGKRQLGIAQHLVGTSMVGPTQRNAEGLSRLLLKFSSGSGGLV